MPFSLLSHPRKARWSTPAQAHISGSAWEAQTETGPSPQWVGAGLASGGGRGSILSVLSSMWPQAVMGLHHVLLCTMIMVMNPGLASASGLSLNAGRA